MKFIGRLLMGALLASAMQAQTQLQPNLPTGAGEERSAVDAEAVFARIKNLAGDWEEKSTKGWTERSKVRVIARGSAVLFEDSLEDEPNEGMATVYYMDSGRVLLTHYCESKTQPTLVASSVSRDGNTVVFTFLSGTGMKSRDQGHMDKLVLKFHGKDDYSEQWTWYGAGQEKWLEEIEARRVSGFKK